MRSLPPDSIDKNSFGINTNLFFPYYTFFCRDGQYVSAHSVFRVSNRAQHMGSQDGRRAKLLFLYL